MPAAPDHKRPPIHPEDALQDQHYIAVTRSWVQRFVVDLNLCPFARRPFEGDQIRYVVSDAGDEATLLEQLAEEMQQLLAQPAVETSLLIHPFVLQDFLDYNRFLDDCDSLLRALELEGVLQIASFHPDYQFADSQSIDAENFSNRSPYPMLHLLREDIVEQAVSAHPAVEGIPERNIACLRDIGADELARRRAECLAQEEDEE